MVKITDNSTLGALSQLRLLTACIGVVMLVILALGFVMSAPEREGSVFYGFAVFFAYAAMHAACGLKLLYVELKNARRHMSQQDCPWHH